MKLLKLYNLTQWNYETLIDCVKYMEKRSEAAKILF